jgi:hypothetical protein
MYRRKCEKVHALECRMVVEVATSYYYRVLGGDEVMMRRKDQASLCIADSAKRCMH